MDARRAGPQGGQVAVMFALVFALVLSGLIATIGDVVLLYDAAGRYDNGALVGAQAGASQVDQSLLRDGTVALDVLRAQTVCREAASVTAGVDGSEVRCVVSADAQSVNAIVSHRVPLVFAQFGPGLSITRVHTGTIAIGESRGSTP